MLALHKHRPRVEVVLAGHGTLDRTSGSFVPHLVVCIRATPLVKEIAHSWIEVTTKDGLDAVVSIGGRRSEIRDVGIDDLLTIVDETESLLPQGQE